MKDDDWLAYCFHTAQQAAPNIKTYRFLCSMKWQQWLGVGACVILIGSCFMNWAWYPDIEQYFSGFYSQNNYYGRPGVLLCFFAVSGIGLHLAKKDWAKRLNLIFSALGMAYALTGFLRYSTGYDGFVPEKQIGIYLMLFSAIVHMVTTMLSTGTKKTAVKAAGEENTTVEAKTAE